MTWGTDQKRHLLTNFRKAWQRDMPKGIGIRIDDQMPLVKTKPERIETVQQYQHDHVIAPIDRVLRDPASEVTRLILLLDRGNVSLSKRLFAHGKRNRGVTPMPHPADGRYVLPTEGLLTNQWDSLLANRDLTRREVYPLFYRAIMETYVPPVGKCVVLDGALERPITQSEYEQTREEAHEKVFMVGSFRSNQPNDGGRQQSSRDVLQAPDRTDSCDVVRLMLPPDEYRHRINEGDLSAFFHVNKYIPHERAPPGTPPGNSILIDSNDGDTIMIALLHCRDRIHGPTSRFNSRLWVKLRGQKRTREAYLARKAKAEAAGKPWIDDVIDGTDAYLNMNMLYKLIDEHPQLSKAQYPQGMFVFLHILAGTDFFGNFSGDQYGLFYFLNWEKHVWNTWCAHADRFRNMLLMTYSGAATFGQPELLRMPFIDEEAVIAFFYQCYATRYGAEIKQLYGVDRVTPELLEKHTGTFLASTERKPNEPDDKWERRVSMARKKRVPPRAILVRYARLALLNITYWINDYRPGGQAMADPLERYRGFPYYGFMAKADGTITLSPVCSIPKPVPEYYVEYTGAHRVNKARREAKARRTQTERDEEELRRQERALRDQERLAAKERKQKRLREIRQGTDPAEKKKRTTTTTTNE